MERRDRKKQPRLIVVPDNSHCPILGDHFSSSGGAGGGAGWKRTPIPAHSTEPSYKMTDPPKLSIPPPPLWNKKINFLLQLRLSSSSSSSTAFVYTTTSYIVFAPSSRCTLSSRLLSTDTAIRAATTNTTAATATATHTYRRLFNVLDVRVPSLDHGERKGGGQLQ